MCSAQYMQRFERGQRVGSIILAGKGLFGSGLCS